MGNDILQPTKFDELRIWGRMENVDGNSFGDVPNELKISIAVGIAETVYSKHCLRNLKFLIDKHDFVCLAIKTALETPFDDSFRINQKLTFMVRNIRFKLRNHIRNEIRRIQNVRLIEQKDDYTDYFENVPSADDDQIDLEQFKPFVDMAFDVTSEKHKQIILELLNGTPISDVQKQFSISRSGVSFARNKFYSEALKLYATQSPERLKRCIRYLYRYENAQFIEKFLLGEKSFSCVVSMIRDQKNVFHDPGHYIYMTLKKCVGIINYGE